MTVRTVRPGESDPIPLYARAHPPAMAAMDFRSLKRLKKAVVHFELKGVTTNFQALIRDGIFFQNAHCSSKTAHKCIHF